MNDTFVSSLRGITEENDLNTILKSTIGGYTKKSVLEYLSYIKSQQQGLREEYLKELELVKEEKESLEKDMDEALARIRSDEARLVQYETESIMLSSAKSRIDELSSTVKIQADEIESLKASESALKNALSDMKASDDSIQLEKLAECCRRLEEEIKIRDMQIESSANECRTLETQLAKCRQLTESVSEELELVHGQNEWLESENKTLTEKLKAEFEREIEINRELSAIKAEKAILQRKFDALMLKLKS